MKVIKRSQVCVMPTLISLKQVSPLENCDISTQFAVNKACWDKLDSLES